MKLLTVFSTRRPGTFSPRPHHYTLNDEWSSSYKGTSDIRRAGKKKELLFMALLSKNFLLPYVRSNRTSGNFLSLSFMCGAMTKTRASIMGRLSLPRLYGQDGIFKGV